MPATTAKLTLGNTTFDIHLNDRAYWRNVPSAVWSYKLGGYQVLKKWLSYRERGVLNRQLRNRRRFSTSRTPPAASRGCWWGVGEGLD